MPIDPDPQVADAGETVTESRALAPKVAAALRRYRFMSFVVGVALLILVVAMVLNYGFGVTWTWVWGPIHGTFYAIYVLFAFDLSQKARWKLSTLLIVLLAGCIPVASFYAEAWVNRSMLAGKRL